MIFIWYYKYLYFFYLSLVKVDILTRDTVLELYSFRDRGTTLPRSEIRLGSGDITMWDLSLSHSHVSLFWCPAHLDGNIPLDIFLKRNWNRSFVALPWCPAFRIPDNITHDLFQGVIARLKAQPIAGNPFWPNEASAEQNQSSMADVALLWRGEFLQLPNVLVRR